MFEDIDTLINLAIDNVKMQKLHLLGITNTNANIFLTLLASGVPLNSVSLMFKSPVIAKISEGKRWTQESIEEISKDLHKTYASNEDLWPEVARILKDEYNVQLSETKISGQSFLPLNSILFGLYGQQGKSTKGLTDELLEKVYTGQASEAETLIANLFLLETMRAMIPLGQETFKQSMIYKGLRYLPNKMWQITSLIDNIESLAHFKGEATGTRGEIKSIAERIVGRITGIEKEEALEFVKEFSSMMYTANNQIRANYVNRVIRKTTSRKVEPSNSSAFSNVAILNLPHVKALYRTAITFRNVLEQIFNIYSPTVQRFVENITKEANLFSAYDSMDKAGEVSKELIKFLTSNLKFKIGDVEVSNYVEGNAENARAWQREFVNTLFKVHNELDDNSFVNSLEFSSYNGVNRAMIVADKLDDDEVIERIRDGFEKLYNTEEVPIGDGKFISGKQLALDLFKYSLMTDSMYYEKTGFSLIFPPEWGFAFAKAFAARMESVIPKDSYTTDANLLSIKDKFLYQLVRARPDLIGRFPKAKPVTVKVPVPQTKIKKTIYAGSTNYQTSNTPRIQVSQLPATVKPTIDLSREWKGDLESRPVYTSEGVNTMRTTSAKPNEHFGNPFSEMGYGNTIKVSSIGAAVRMYKDWLLNGAVSESEIVTGGIKALEKFDEQRLWILDQINQGKLDNATLLYAGKLEARGQGTHAKALLEVIEKLRSETTITSRTFENENATATVHYDLVFPVAPNASTPRFISYYDQGVFMLVDTPGSGMSYYVKIGDKTPSAYNFSLFDLDKSFDLKALFNLGDYKLVNSSIIQGGKIRLKKKKLSLQKFDRVLAIDLYSVDPTTATAYYVKDIQESEGVTTYILGATEQRPMYSTQLIERVRKGFKKFLNTDVNATVVVDTVSEYFRKERTSKDLEASTIVISPKEERSIKLPFFNIPKDLTEQQQQDILDETAVILNEKVKDGATIVITKDVFDSVRRYKILNRGLVDLFYNKLNYIDRILPPTNVQQKSPELTIAIKENELDVEMVGNISLTKDASGLVYTPAQGPLAKKKEGDILYFGNGLYAFVSANTGTNLTMFTFDKTFLQELEKGMKTADFIEVYNQKNKC